MLDRFCDVRRQSEALCEDLEPEDFVVQSMPDASPVKWHLAHTTWFFERMVLAEFAANYTPFHPGFDYLFNSYYLSVGQMHSRAQRGLLTRPTVDQVRAYRHRVDECIQDLMTRDHRYADVIASRVAIGLAHEEQHQELLLTDLKHAFSLNPLEPVYSRRRKDSLPQARGNVAAAPIAIDGGVYEVGHHGPGFAFDNESPRHRVYLHPFEIHSRPVSCAEYIEFMADGGYLRPELWLSEGWVVVEQTGARMPLYWRNEDGCYTVFTLLGRKGVVPDEPICHLSYYEADAYARWAGARLPSEAEWEVAASAARGEAGFALHPAPVVGDPGTGAWLGGVWEWTRSAYGPYPGFRPLNGALAEYNGKFMCSQMVLRGGSCVTPRGHIRLTYRNFFHPGARWQFSGVRLASDR